MMKVLALIGIGVALMGCGGSNNNSNPTYVPPGCVLGQVCNYNALSAGSAVVYQGQVTGIDSSVAKRLALAQNGNLFETGMSFQFANLTITGQGNTTGGTTYNINLTIQPVQKNFFSICGSMSSSCNNPIIVTGNASYYPMADGTQWLTLQYGGIKLEVIAANVNSTNNAFDGTVSALSNVQVKVVRPGQDFMHGDLLGTAYLTTYQVGAGYTGGPLPSTPTNFVSPPVYSVPNNGWNWGW